MTGKPATAREALLAELIGDMHLLLERVESADSSSRATTKALNEATLNYRTQVDEMTARLRSETASIITHTTEHAAKSLVGQQATTLQHAATLAMKNALTDQFLRRSRVDWLIAAGIGGISATVAFSLLQLVMKL